ncbi:MAG: homoserine O-succinyltransferase [Eubacteriales bacterium]
MPIKIPQSLPAAEILESENIFVMDEARAVSQDIRPLKIAILNLMPNKEVTETQILRLLSNTPLQIDVQFLTTASYVPKHTSKKHLVSFYKTFDEIKHQKQDGLIVTGAPVEYLEFDQIYYWDELCEIMSWANENVFSTLYVCWGAYAGLYHNCGIKKHPLAEKISGIFTHRSLLPSNPLLRGFDEFFAAPHSRYSYVKETDIQNHPDLLLLASSREAGVYLAASKTCRQVYVMGHPEYDDITLKLEYERDKQKGLSVELPKNYFPANNPKNKPFNTWRSHSHLLYSNWLNYYVYQITPYNIEEIGK